MFQLLVYGAEHDELTDAEKEELAQLVHDALVENWDVFPDSVGVEGYGE